MVAERNQPLTSDNNAKQGQQLLHIPTCYHIIFPTCVRQNTKGLLNFKSLLLGVITRGNQGQTLMHHKNSDTRPSTHKEQKTPQNTH